MSSVVLAEDTLLGRRVALKRLHAREDARARSRLRREALLGAAVSHPNLVSIYDVITGGTGETVIVMEYVEGETLRDAIRRDGPLPVRLALRVLEAVAAALDSIHARGIVHRDVKPSNILLGKDGMIKLADLGVASAPDGTRITTEGGIVGTFSYMAPEQLGGSPAAPAADIYALAALAFEALSGRKARTEPNPVAVAHAIASGPPPDLRDAWPKAPSTAAKLLMRGMSRNPKDRPASAGELVTQLRETLAPPAAAGASSPRPAPAPGPSRPRDRRWILAAVLVPVVALAAAIAAIAASTGGSSSSRTRAAAPSHRPARPRAPTQRAANGLSASRRAASQRAPSQRALSAAPAEQPSRRAPASGAAAPAAGGSAPAGGGPVSAVERFYTLAAGHDYPGAWALADPAFESQLGGYQGFRSTMTPVRSITFESAQTVSRLADTATVAIRTISVQTSRTQHCAGTVQLVRSGARAWLIHQIGIACV
jgi:serine/threonine-protein kinase